MSTESYNTQYDARMPIETRLSLEEIRVLKECNRESFLYRCVPLGIMATSATYLGVQKGFLKGHPKYGATFKLLGAGILGWIVGKISYRSKCEEKFINLPNSSIGEAIRKKRGYTLSEFQADTSPLSDKDDRTFYSGDPKSLPDQNYDASFGALNLDSDKNIQSPGLDDRERPTTDSYSGFGTEENHPPQSSTTYADLRKQNRDIYEQQFRKSPSQGVSSPQTLYESIDRRSGFQESTDRRRGFDDSMDRRRGFEESMDRRRGFQEEGPKRSQYGD